MKKIIAKIVLFCLIFNIFNIGTTNSEENLETEGFEYINIDRAVNDLNLKLAHDGSILNRTADFTRDFSSEKQILGEIKARNRNDFFDSSKIKIELVGVYEDMFSEDKCGKIENSPISIENNNLVLKDNEKNTEPKFFTIIVRIDAGVFGRILKNFKIYYVDDTVGIEEDSDFKSCLDLGLSPRNNLSLADDNVSFNLEGKSIDIINDFEVTNNGNLDISDIPDILFLDEIEEYVVRNDLVINENSRNDISFSGTKMIFNNTGLVDLRFKVADISKRIFIKNGESPVEAAKKINFRAEWEKSPGQGDCKIPQAFTKVYFKNKNKEGENFINYVFLNDWETLEDVLKEDHKKDFEEISREKLSLTAIGKIDDFIFNRNEYTIKEKDNSEIENGNFFYKKFDGEVPENYKDEEANKKDYFFIGNFIYAKEVNQKSKIFSIVKKFEKNLGFLNGPENHRGVFEKIIRLNFNGENVGDEDGDVENEITVCKKIVNPDPYGNGNNKITYKCEKVEVTPEDFSVDMKKCKSKGTVTTKFVNEENEEIAEKVVSEEMEEGEDYTTSAKDVEGYTLKTTPNNANGKVSAGNTEVVYVYSKNIEIKKGRIVVKFVDENNNELEQSISFEKNFGEKYSTNSKNIPNYILKNTPENANGNVEKENIEVIYIYKKVSKDLGKVPNVEKIPEDPRVNQPKKDKGRVPLEPEEKIEIEITPKVKEKIKEKFIELKEKKKVSVELNEENSFIKEFPPKLPKTGAIDSFEIYRKVGLIGKDLRDNVELRLPKRETFRLAGSENTDLDYWMQVIPKQDRNKNQYIVLPSQGLAMPFNSVSKNDEAFKNFTNGGNEDFDDYLRDGAVEIPSSPNNFGEAGNKVIAGHSSYWVNGNSRYKTHFQKIIGMEAGEEIWIYTKNSSGEFDRFVYRVNDSFNTFDYDISILEPSKKSVLTLFTCTPIGGDAGRWIVKADFVSKD